MSRCPRKSAARLRISWVFRCRSRPRLLVRFRVPARPGVRVAVWPRLVVRLRGVVRIRGRIFMLWPWVGVTLRRLRWPGCGSSTWWTVAGVRRRRRCGGRRSVRIWRGWRGTSGWRPGCGSVWSRRVWPVRVRVIPRCRPRRRVPCTAGAGSGIRCRLWSPGRN